MRSLILLILALTVLGIASPVATAQNGAGVAVERQWARASIGTSRPAAAYLTLVNTGQAKVRLVEIETPVAERAEIHRTIQKGEVMRMELAGNLELSPGERIVLEPGGLHLMLMDLRQSLDKGGSFPLTLRFADGGTTEAAVPVMGPGARGPAD